MARPTIPMGAAPDGTETLTVRQNGALARLTLATLRVFGRGETGPKGDTGAQGIQGVAGSRGADGPAGPAGPVLPLRVVETTASASTGLARCTFAPPFASIPDVRPFIGWVGTPALGKLVVAIPSNIAKDGCDVTIVASRGTLLLTSGPFEPISGYKAPMTVTGQ